MTNIIIQENFAEGLPCMEEFFKKHSDCDLCIYMILRDLFMKEEYSSLFLITGNTINIQGYIISGELSSSISTCTNRFFLPINIDDDIDLIMLNRILNEFLPGNSELYICIHSLESIIYQHVDSKLP